MDNNGSTLLMMAGCWELCSCAPAARRFVSMYTMYDCKFHENSWKFQLANPSHRWEQHSQSPSIAEQPSIFWEESCIWIGASADSVVKRSSRAADFRTCLEPTGSSKLSFPKSRLMMIMIDPDQTHPNIPFELREPQNQIDHVTSLVKISLSTKPSCGSKDLQMSHRNHRTQTFFPTLTLFSTLKRVQSQPASAVFFLGSWGKPISQGDTPVAIMALALPVAGDMPKWCESESPAV